MDLEKLWNDFKVFLNKLLKAIKDSFKRIVFNLIGNFFPIYFGFGILYFLPSNILNEDADFNSMFKPISLIVYSVTFFVSSIFLWFKNLKSKPYIILLLFFIFYMSISGLFVLSYIKDIQNQKIYLKICQILCLLSIGIYIYQEIKNSYYEINSDFQENRNEDFEDLRNKIRKNEYLYGK